MTTLLLHRAYQNFGDFLIYERAKSLIQHVLPDEELLEGHSGKPLEEQKELAQSLGKVNRVIIPGGPGVVEDMFPRIYPLVSTVLEHKIPLFSLGLGSYLTAGKTPSSFAFTSSSSQMLEHMNSFSSIGTRDLVTKRLLEAKNFKAKVNGCPGWYHIDSLGKGIEKNKTIGSIVFSAPAMFSSIPFFFALVREFSEKNPQVKISISMNHGVANQRDKIIAAFCKDLGAKILDLSGGTQNSGLYDDHDFHVGFRVHSHIYFLSKRYPSVLFSEDQRGVGANESLGLEEPSFEASSTNTHPLYWLTRNKYLVSRSQSQGVVQSAKEAVEKLSATMNGPEKVYDPCFENIDRTYKQEMKPFVESMILKKPRSHPNCDKKPSSSQ